jgi:hypothetical protein
LSSRLRLAASLAGRRHAFAMPATTFYPCPAFRPKHLSLFSLTGDPSKPGTGTTLLFYGGVNAYPDACRPPGPVLDATKPSFHSARS